MGAVQKVRLWYWSMKKEQPLYRVKAHRDCQFDHHFTDCTWYVDHEKSSLEITELIDLILEQIDRDSNDVLLTFSRHNFDGAQGYLFKTDKEKTGFKYSIGDILSYTVAGHISLCFSALRYFRGFPEHIYFKIEPIKRIKLK